MMGLCRSCSASTRRRSRRRSKCATPTRARWSRDGRAPHPPTTPPRSEQDPSAWWDALRRGAAARPARDDVDAVAVAGQQHGLVVLDAADEVVRPAKLWNDTESAPDARVAGQAARRARRRGPTACGSVPVAAFTITKLSWLHRSEPDAWARLARVCLPHDWLTLQADGRVRHRPRRRVGHRLLLGRDGRVPRRPARDRRRATSTGRPRLPRVLGPTERAGTTTRSVDAIVAPGTGDNMAAALGVGARAGRRRVSLGTSGTVYTVSDDADRRRDRRGRGVRRRDRPVPPARVHAQRDQGHRRDRAAARRRPRGARRARARGAAGRRRRRARARTSTASARRTGPTRPARSPGCAPTSTREAARARRVRGRRVRPARRSRRARPRPASTPTATRARRRRRAVAPRTGASLADLARSARRRSRRGASTSPPARACRRPRCCRHATPRRSPPRGVSGAGATVEPDATGRPRRGARRATRRPRDG